MIVNDKTQKQYLCKYKVTQLLFFMDDVKIQFDPSSILSIEYINDYEFNLMNILRLTLRMDIRRKLWILKNKKFITVKFILDKVGLDLEAEKEIIAPSEVWNQEFNMYFNDDEENTDVELLEQRLELNEGEAFLMNETDKESYNETQNFLDVFLFNKDIIEASRFNHNKIYTNNTLQNIIGEMLTESKHPKVLMSKVENDEVYKELLLPPNPLYKNLAYLEQYFGLYEKGALFYYDLDKLYILNLNGKMTAKEEDEWPETFFLVNKIGNAIPGNGMLRVEDEKKYYVNITEMEIEPEKLSIGKNIEQGSQTKVVVLDESEISTNKAEQTYIGNRNESILYIKKINKYTPSVLKARMEENECIMTINTKNVDINAFTPNKEFYVVFEETLKYDKYSKCKYRLAYAYHVLKLESDQYWTSMHKFVLKKVEGELYNQGDDSSSGDGSI